MNSSYKTKYQYFKESKQQKSPPLSPLQMESDRKFSPQLKLQVQNEGDYSAAYNSNPSNQTSTQSQINQTFQTQRGKMKTIHTSEYSPSMQMRSYNVNNNLQDPSTNPNIIQQSISSGQFQFNCTTPVENISKRFDFSLQKLTLLQQTDSKNQKQEIYRVDHIQNLNSARGPAARQENIKLQKKQKLNKSVDDDFELEDFNADEDIQDIGKQCECSRRLSNFNEKDFMCQHAKTWIEITYQDKYDHEIFKKMYEGFLTSAPQLRYLRNMIKKDVERTFTNYSCFQQPQMQIALMRVLIAYAHYEPQISYVQGMNFVAASLLYHAGEVASFWLLLALMDQYKLKEIYKQNLPGLKLHESAIQQLGQQYLSEVFEHLEKSDIQICYFSTEWIMSLFLSCIPLRINAVYLNEFFENKWTSFYKVAIALLQHLQKKILQLDEFPAIIGLIKQAREGCDYLLPQNLLQLDQSSVSIHSIMTLSRMSSRSEISFNHKKHYKLWKNVLKSAFISEEFEDLEDNLANFDIQVLSPK
eukprot:403357196